MAIRGLFPQPLGPSGLHWIKIQLANTFATGGVDKLPLDGRVAFAEDNESRILDCASDPMRHTWWQEAENPFQVMD